MTSKCLEAKYLFPATIEKSFWIVNKYLTMVYDPKSWEPQGLPCVEIKNAEMFTRILCEFRSKNDDMKREFEFTFERGKGNTLVVFRWFYPSNWRSMKEFDSTFFKDMKMFNAIEGGLFLVTTDSPTHSVDIRKTEEISTKTKCIYCSGFYVETLDKCPHCGAPQRESI